MALSQPAPRKVAPFIRFIWDVGERWNEVLAAILGGGAIVAFEHLREQPLSLPVALGATFLALGRAFYLVWRDKDQEVGAAHNEIENLRQRVASSSSAILGPDEKPLASLPQTAKEPSTQGEPLYRRVGFASAFAIVPIAIVYLNPQITMAGHAAYIHAFNPPIAQLTDGELIIRATSLSADLNSLQNECDSRMSRIESDMMSDAISWSEGGKEIEDANSTCQLEFRTKFQSEAQSVVGDLERRIAPLALPSAGPERSEVPGALGGSLAGADPLTALATYLTDLSNALKTKDEAQSFLPRSPNNYAYSSHLHPASRQAPRSA